MKMAPLRVVGSGTVRKGGLVRVGVASLKEVCHWGRKKQRKNHLETL